MKRQNKLFKQEIQYLSLEKNQIINDLIFIRTSWRIYSFYLYSNIQKSMSEETSSSIPTISAATIKKLIIGISIFALLLSLTSSAFSLVLVYIHQRVSHHGYGEMNLTANAVGTILGSSFAPWAFQKFSLSSKKWLAICAVCYFLNVFVPSLMPLQAPNPDGQIPLPTLSRAITEMAANLVGGWGSGILWVLHGLYMSDLCKNQEDHHKGKYFSISSAIINGRYIGSPLLIIFGLGYGNQKFFFTVLTIIAFLTIPYPLFFLSQIKLGHKQVNQPNAQQQQHNEENLQLQVANLENRSRCPFLWSYLQYIWRVRKFLPITLVTGLLVGFVTSSLSHLLPKSSSTDIKLGIALLFYGIGNVIGGSIGGILCDKISSLAKVGAIGIILGIFSNSLESLILITGSYSLISTSVVAFFVSLSFSYLSCYILVICAVCFNGDGEAFAIMRQATILSYLFYQWFVRFVNNSSNMQSNMIFQSFLINFVAVLSVFSLYSYKNFKNSRQNSLERSNLQMSDVSANSTHH